MAFRSEQQREKNLAYKLDYIRENLPRIKKEYGAIQYPCKVHLSIDKFCEFYLRDEIFSHMSLEERKDQARRDMIAYLVDNAVSVDDILTLNQDKIRRFMAAGKDIFRKTIFIEEFGNKYVISSLSTQQFFWKYSPKLEAKISIEINKLLAQRAS
jgi:hypothetical protein